jgi:hypothetical protein
MNGITGMYKSISRVPTALGELNRFQDQVVPALNDVLKNVISKESIIEVTLSTSPVKVNHKLGRKPTGWIVVYSNAAAIVFTTEVSDSDIIELKANTTVTVKLIFI